MFVGARHLGAREGGCFFFFFLFFCLVFLAVFPFIFLLMIDHIHVSMHFI